MPGSEAVIAVETSAPANGAALNGVRVTTANGWFAARLVGHRECLQNLCRKLRRPDHLRHIQRDAQAAVDGLIDAVAVA